MPKSHRKHEPGRPLRLSRRGMIVSMAGGLAISTTGGLGIARSLGSSPGMDECDLCQGPTSEDAEVVLFGQLPSHPDQSGAPVYAYHLLFLQGDWSDTAVVDGVAWGEGHSGQDVWTHKRTTCRPHLYRLGLTQIVPYPGCPGYYYFAVKLEVGDSASKRIGALFRYVRHGQHHGTLVAAFRFPAPGSAQHSMSQAHISV